MERQTTTETETMKNVTLEDLGIIKSCIVYRREDIRDKLKNPVFCDENKESYRRELYKLDTLYLKLNNRTA
jgi:hypothetical protein